MPLILKWRFLTSHLQYPFIGLCTGKWSIVVIISDVTFRLWCLFISFWKYKDWQLDTIGELEEERKALPFNFKVAAFVVYGNVTSCL